MDGGRIAESGTHAQLLRKNGIYKRICGVIMFSTPTASVHATSVIKIDLYLER